MEKIAIHYRKGSFSDGWITYCEKNSIPYKLVNAYDNNIVEQVDDCTAFMWHHHHANYKDCLFAKQLLYSLQKKGIKVFPNFNTTWHFDDKLGQKYLLEAINAPLVPTYVFYTKEQALTWIKSTNFPKVFKLRGGAGALNVRLVESIDEAKNYINMAFGNGFSQFNRFTFFKEQIQKFINGTGNLIGVLKGIFRLFFRPKFDKMSCNEKGYIYFQDFIPNNSFDIRVVVVNGKAIALKRNCRKNDFRASGSGDIIYDKNQIDERCVSIAFNVNKVLKSQSIAYDFVFDPQNNPLIVEISYGFTSEAYDKCEGYWTENLEWHAGISFDICGGMVETILTDDILE